MYIARLFEETDLDKIKAFIREHSFATLVSIYKSRPVASHIPIELEQNSSGEFILTGHVAKANEIWRSFAPDQQILAIFTGPHAYVSSTWYDHVNVPTWNYMAIHIYGKPRIVTEDELYTTLRKLMQKHETESAQPAEIEALPVEFLKKEMQRIVGFEISLDKIEANYKLSQNRGIEDYENVIRKLEARGDENSEAVAAEMAKRKSTLFAASEA